MPKYIAFFRGINVGGRNILPMKELVEILQGMGFENVRTYIQSGNVVFESRKKPDGGAIAKRIQRQKGFAPDVLLLSEKDLTLAVRDNPFPTDDGKALHFFFLQMAPKKPQLERLESLKVRSEEFELAGAVFYLHAPEGVGRSKLAANAEKALGVAATARNWNTVRKLVEMVSPEWGAH